MRKALRVTFAVLFVYLLQTTVLPYFKINGVMLDLLAITMCCIGFSCGMYTGFTAGLFAALIMETVSGDLAGLTAVTYIGAGPFGAWLRRRILEFTRVGNRAQERAIKQFAPMVAFGFYVALKETIYLLYFYLTGVDIGFIHIFRVLFAGLQTMLLSFLLLPLEHWYLTRRPEDTFLGRLVAKRRKEKKGKPDKKPLPAGFEPVREAVRRPAQRRDDPLDGADDAAKGGTDV